MITFITWLEGKKTYFVALMTYLYAMSALATGHMTLTQALGYVLASGGLAALRGAVAKVEEYLPLIEEIWALVHPAPTPTPAPTQVTMEHVQAIQAILNAPQTTPPQA